MKTLYLIECGIATPTTPEAPFDGTNNVLVLAESPEVALELAIRYDHGEVEIGNWCHEGKIVAAINE